MFKRIKNKLGLGRSSKPFVERPVRLHIDPFLEVKYRVIERGMPELELGVANLSITGLSFYPAIELDRLIKRNTTFFGQLVLPTARFPLELKIVHTDNGVVGCAFQGEYSQVQNEIRRFFAHEIAALEMVEVKREILKDEPDGDPRLFRGRNNCELFLVEKNGQLVRFQLSIFGNYIEGGKGLRTRVGTLVPESQRNKYKGSTLVRLVSELPPEMKDAALKFIDHVPTLGQVEREIIRAAVLDRALPSSQSGSSNPRT